MSDTPIKQTGSASSLKIITCTRGGIDTDPILQFSLFERLPSQTDFVSDLNLLQNQQTLLPRNNKNLGPFAQGL